jgi:hypothetical protein
LVQFKKLDLIAISLNKIINLQFIKHVLGQYSTSLMKWVLPRILQGQVHANLSRTSITFIMDDSMQRNEPHQEVNEIEAQVVSRLYQKSIGQLTSCKAFVLHPQSAINMKRPITRDKPT